MPKSKKPVPKHPHLQYAMDVVSGEIVACRAIIQQCERTLAEHDNGYVDADLYGEKNRFIWSKERAYGRVNFIHRCPHVKGDLAAKKKNIVLSPWQLFFVCEVYGWVHEDDEFFRRYNEAILFIGRKNGKTTLAAPLGLHEALAGDEGAEVYVASTKEEQSGILWDIASEMAKRMRSAMMGAQFRITSKEIASRRGIFKHLPGKASSQDGLNPSLALFDESAAVTDANQIHVIESGMASRKSPLALHLTTAQPLRTTLFRGLYEATKKGLATGTLVYSTFALLYEMDDPEEVHDPEMWIKSNPNIGISVHRRHIGGALEKSKNNPITLSNTLCKHFNIWAQHATAWIPIDIWDACAGELTREGVAYIGIDLAETRDLCAVCVLWDNGGNRYSVDWKFWTPRSSLDLYPDDDRKVLERAVQDGTLELTEKAIVDHDEIIEWVDGVYDVYNVDRIAIDDWHAKRTATKLTEKGYEILSVAQSKAKLTDPIQELERCVVSGALTHPGYGILSWMMGNVVAHTLNGIRLQKPDGEHHRKIDGIDAMVNAFACVDYSAGAFSVSDFDIVDEEDTGKASKDSKEDDDEGLMYV